MVGVSQCLLGDAVRYDGQSKANRIILQQLAPIFKFVPVCPEVEAGLAIPRPAVQLTGSMENPRLIGRDDASVDVTNVMQRYCEKKPAELTMLSGFIFKSRSPSCGLNSTPVFIDGQCITENSRGIFTRRLCESHPDLVTIEDSSLENPSLLDDFIRRVMSA